MVLIIILWLFRKTGEAEGTQELSVLFYNFFISLKFFSFFLMFKKSCNTPPGHKVIHVINHLTQVTLPGTVAPCRLHVHMVLRTDHVVPHLCVLVHAFARTSFLFSHLGHLNSSFKTEGIALPSWGLPILLKRNQPRLCRELGLIALFCQLFHYKREGHKSQSYRNSITLLWGWWGVGVGGT